MRDEAGPGNHADTGDMDIAAEVKTPFAAKEDVDSMKDMVIDARPELVFDVADTWKAIHDDLVIGGGSVKSDFDKAIDHVLQHWEGEAADEFAKKAKKLSKQIAEGAAYADYISVAMRNAGERLNEIKPQIDAIGKPDGFAGAKNLLGIGPSPDGGGWRDGIQSNRGVQGALNGEGKGFAGKKEQLKAAALMERLAMTYSSQTIAMGSWRRPSGTQDQADYPGHPGGVAPVPVDVTPEQGGAGPVPPGIATSGKYAGQSAAAPKSTAETKSQGAASTASAASTNGDGVSGGTATGPRPGGANGGAPAVGISGFGVSTGPNPGAAGRVPGGLGSAGPGSGSREVTGRGAGALDARGDAAASRGGGGRAPDGGIPHGHVPGARAPGGLGADHGTMGGLGGARDRSKGGVPGRGPVAPQSSGTSASPLQGKSPSRQSGQGLHSSRGGGTAGDRGRSGNGVSGVGLGGEYTDNRPTKYERGNAELPDYFVDDKDI